MNNFEQAFAKVVGIEGRYSNNPNDAGGETMYGITAATARRFKYFGPMAQMPLAVAHDIYDRGWWQPHRCDDICNIAGYRVGEEVFECAVNLPPGRAGEFLQRALNSFNLRGARYPDVEVDGLIGDMTIGALRAFIRQRGVQGSTVMLRALNSQQGVHYLERGEARPENEDFTYGWFWNRVYIG